MILPLAPSVVDKFKEEVKAFRLRYRAGKSQLNCPQTVSRPSRCFIFSLKWLTLETHLLLALVMWDMRKKWPLWSRPAAGRDQVGERFKSCGLWASEMVQWLKALATQAWSPESSPLIARTSISQGVQRGHCFLPRVTSLPDFELHASSL